jgi:integrase
MIKTIPHPTEGSSINIEPFRSLADVDAIRAVIFSPRDKALFSLGVNSALRASDLLSVRACDFDWLTGVLRVKEGKTKKKRVVMISPALQELLLDILPTDPNGYMFPSIKGGAPISISAWNNKIKAWARAAGIKGNFGARTIRKTFARLQYEIFGVDIVDISMELNHSSPRETYLYIALPAPEQAAIFRNQI